MPIDILTSTMGENRTTKKGPEPGEWDAMQGIIQRLYIEEGRTMHDTRFILALVYHFHPYTS